MGTKFTEVYDCFFGKITDDMYLELTPEDTLRDLQHMILCAIPEFEFPRKNLNDFEIKIEEKLDEDLVESDFVLGHIWNELEKDGYPDDLSSQTALVESSSFKAELSHEEIDILATIMMGIWLQRQVTSIENIRMKYTGSDFKMTSQANHLSKLLSLQTEVRRQSHHKQRLYKRRRFNNKKDLIESNWDVLRFGTYNVK